MNTLVFKTIDSMFWDSEFKNSEYEGFATTLFLLAIATQSWNIPKAMILKWHSSYKEEFIKKGWLREKDDHYEMSLKFQGNCECEIERSIRLGKIAEQPITEHQTFQVGSYTIQIEECREVMKKYLMVEQ